ncbi:MAG TPA: serpin family protein [Gemmatimonadaceae bacterium]|nr:serpin family protein [Gemmatimonadaceae bacterium]
MRLIRRMLWLSGVAVAACSDPSGPSGPPAKITTLPRQLSATEQAMIGASNAFGVRLLQEVNGAFADSNVFLSPLSASMALGMTMNGAEGTTFEEMRSALGFGTQSYAELNASYQSLITLLRGLDPHVDFRIANAIYYDQMFGSAIEPTFLSEAEEYFDAEVDALDFHAPAAVTTVNDWANRNTNGKIPEIIDQIDPATVMLLMNAIYFKGDWRHGFDPKETQDLPFTTHDGTVVQAKTMHRKGEFRAGHDGSTTVVELPYGGDAYVMTILLPDPETPIDAFVNSLTPDTWSAATAGLTDSRGDLYLPKFKLAWEDMLNDELKRMGMVRAFVPDGAEFTRISRSLGNHLFVSFVKQKAFVDVNEVGTEAAAVTITGVEVTSAPPQIRIDRPFVFALRERLSGTILFLGKIVEPEY